MKKYISMVFIFIPMSFGISFFKPKKVYRPSDKTKNEYVGIDISKYQGHIDWESVDSIDFVVCKKSEGITLEDSKFSYNIKNIPCLKGVYHFFRPQFSGIEQGKFFLRNLEPNDIDIIPVIDVEYSKWWGSNNREIGVKRLQDMITYIDTSFGCKPIIYTSPKFWNRYISSDIDTCSLKLWVADWRDSLRPEIPKGFCEWVMWQKTSTGKINGIDGFVDVDIVKSIDDVLIKE